MVGLGADLQAGTLLAAYRAGIFPMPIDDGRMGWWSPDPRGIIPLDGLHASRRLRRSATRFEIRVDIAFAEVVASCAAEPRPHGWITAEIEEAYGRLHALGWAHSVEAWRDGELAGGLYGVAVGGLFAGESMFHSAPDASKVALLTLVDLLTDGDPLRAAAEGRLLDVQWCTPHLASLGAEALPRDEYLQRLERALRLPLPGCWADAGQAGMAASSAPLSPALAVGLCSGCVHARQVAGARTQFWRCGLADTDPGFVRYPRLPVVDCAGYQPSSAERATSAAGGPP
ncbi:MAG TPA: leucyl/phenylalanyl-tRNA--protein transferase [Candidatus Dormibacteraeota bacterium]